jgi:hypothetical protein
MLGLDAVVLVAWRRQYDENYEEDYEIRDEVGHVDVDRHLRGAVNRNDIVNRNRNDIAIGIINIINVPAAFLRAFLRLLIRGGGFLIRRGAAVSRRVCRCVRGEGQTWAFSFWLFILAMISFCFPEEHLIRVAVIFILGCVIKYSK